ncbi:MAG: hypothetical protein ACO38G_08160, partial [Burkholderiaceae bacterium]
MNASVDDPIGAAPTQATDDQAHWAQDTLRVMLLAQQQESKLAWRWKLFFLLAWLLIWLAE